MLQMFSDAVDLFSQSLPDMKESVKFKALEYDVENAQEETIMSDLIATAIGLEVAKKCPKEYFYNTTSENVDNHISVYIHASIHKDEFIEKTDDALVCASGVGHLPPENHLIAKNVLYDA